eukprot:444584_1
MTTCLTLFTWLFVTISALDDPDYEDINWKHKVPPEEDPNIEEWKKRPMWCKIMIYSEESGIGDWPQDACQICCVDIRRNEWTHSPKWNAVWKWDYVDCYCDSNCIAHADKHDRRRLQGVDDGWIGGNDVALCDGTCFKGADDPGVLDIDKKCESNVDCGGCLKCCPKRKVCEVPPPPRPPAAKSELLQHDIINIGNKHDFVEDKRFYQYPAFGLISYVGFVLFILILFRGISAYITIKTIWSTPAWVFYGSLFMVWFLFFFLTSNT